ncbi:hypothetical protein ABN36_18245 [Salmonella enterica subsp. enterica]|nr:hypothetical protein [Salmonella enterica subsp. enterica]ECM8230944.1 hypothetical protein [Salmonella enterica subsp. enterica serovar Kentucky]EGI6509420.1 hypothetical protein [Salmonella enterica subsp. enterica serovar Durham]EHW9667335.1 hypothetical protein [Salmonella enterica subsp. enterica serovar Agbeni]EJI2509777.1 hypothetical protein [Salmonella enterica]
MTGDQVRFQIMVEQYPTLAPYWDFEKREVKVKTSADLPVSSGEKILMSFFLSVWFGRNVDFDITRAAGVLSTENKLIIAEWFLDPFWP